MNIQGIRSRIDEIDLELLALLEERMELGLRVRRFKSEATDRSREAVVLDRAMRSSLALVEPEFAESLFAEIMAESRRLQTKGLGLVAFQGEHGAFSEIAARALVTDSAYVPCSEFVEVFRGVEEGTYDLGVVPVENSLEGAVSQVNDLLTRTELKVVGEVRLAIHQDLLAAKGTDLRDIRVVYSHPQALAQCRDFVARNGLEPRPYYDTAGAARMIAAEKPRGAAAIASTLAAELYGLRVIKERVEDDASNSTRFLLLSRQAAGSGDKSSIVFVTPHESGRLFGVLELFASAGLNLTRIASMPYRPDPRQYSFFLDFEGSDKNPKVVSVLNRLKERAVEYRFLGCYPVARA
jgi:prephenate dehydratase/chorismate mutase